MKIATAGRTPVGRPVCRQSSLDAIAEDASGRTVLSRCCLQRGIAISGNGGTFSSVDSDTALHDFNRFFRFLVQVEEDQYNEVADSQQTDLLR